MDGQAQNLYVRVGWYIRPTRTLVTASVLPGVGGRRHALWSGGYRLDMDAARAAALAPADLPLGLMSAMLTDPRLEPMALETIRAWQRTWRPDRP